MQAGLTSPTLAIMLALLLLATLASCTHGQRITTIQLDGVQYFISRMNPYSPELNYFLAYQYCRSIGLQLASFETKEKSDSIMEYLKNAGYDKYDFWTSGNRLGTEMMIWMSTGLPFNATFDYMRKAPGEDMPVARQLGAVEQRKDTGSADGCVALRAPDLAWDTDDCTNIKDFICEQTRCYYYNYGSIPVSSSQGNKIRTTTAPQSTTTPAPMAILTNSKTPSSFTSAAEGTTRNPLISEFDSHSLPEETTEMNQNPTENEVNEGIVVEETTDSPSTLRAVARNKQGQQTDLSSEGNVPWSWARNIMLEKAVPKKPATLSK